MCRVLRSLSQPQDPGVKSPDLVEWMVAKNLAFRIVEKLDGFSKVTEDRKEDRIHIVGHLPLADESRSTRKRARCDFVISSQWVRKIPTVVCHEPWLTRKLPEWHADADGKLCYEFDLRWERELSLMVEQFTLGLTADYASKWLLNSTRSLLNRHLFASRHNIANWPARWDFWAHGTADAERQLVLNR